MPKAAAALDAAVDILPIEAMAAQICSVLSIQTEPGGSI